jgi:ABC-type hemin transport system substrate-binding protein
MNVSSPCVQVCWLTELRLISFLPAATEMVFALGLGDRLVGVSRECDFPAPAKPLFSNRRCV